MGTIIKQTAGAGDLSPGHVLSAAGLSQVPCLADLVQATALICAKDTPGTLREACLLSFQA